ncbi:hypothetical protein E3N88_01914 [Mikania micrantha]|uniref:Uncharacterized protein n=1 Tax=Mikania micrantha TaxID=192012 RepID=A0A5N6Q4M7_9ASTR|nr:hypothetical protein E3N88_01914 [Mikania micrantha]
MQSSNIVSSFFNGGSPCGMWAVILSLAGIRNGIHIYLLGRAIVERKGQCGKPSTPSTAWSKLPSTRRSAFIRLKLKALVYHRPLSAPSLLQAEGSLTARPTRRVGTKDGLSDQTVPSGRAVGLNFNMLDVVFVYNYFTWKHPHANDNIGCHISKSGDVDIIWRWNINEGSLLVMASIEGDVGFKSLNISSIDDDDNG